MEQQNLQKLYFIHIRKTAGTSMRSIFEKYIPKSQTCPELSQPELMVKHKGEDLRAYLHQFLFITGHYYDIPKYFIEKRFTFTMLREPLARVISEINQIQNNEKDIYHKKSLGLTVEEMLEDPFFEKPLNNNQVRVLVGNAGAGYDGLDDNKRLQIAKAYLEEIDFFGLTEFFEASMRLLCSQLEWKVPKKAPKINTKITENGIKKHHQLPFMQKLYEKNILDIMLYDHAQKVFDERIVEYMDNLAS